VKTQYLVLEPLSIGDLAQLTLQFSKIWLFSVSSYDRPCLWSLYMYLRLQMTTFLWSIHKVFMNWFTIPTTKTSLLFPSRSEKNSSYSVVHILFGSTGLSTSLYIVKSIIPIYFRIFRAYFLWEMLIPSFDWATLMPKIYLRYSRSLGLKMIVQVFL